MSKEIKFEVWDTHLKTMLKDAHLYHEFIRYLTDSRYIKLQFTGLQDKNGKDIYNGNILGSEGMVIGYVIGGVRGYCYDVIYKTPLSNGETRWSLYATVTSDYKDRIEILGNIYEHPHLLNEH